ncbi:MAG: hypothetical protein JWO61_393 [Candidatus Saccharibacteria bacterium]|nr:hypothetical protein [Candidatus Saccharibacteria bacterium]
MITAVAIIVGIALVFGLVVLRGAPYVPSHANEVKEAFQELYPLGGDDVLIDAGSGDGIILRLAAKQGARAIGYELNPFLVVISWLLKGGNRRIKIELVDFWFKQLPAETTIVYAFSVSRDVDKLADKLQQETNQKLKPLYLMTYGASLHHKKAIKKRRGHHLYKFVPLQEEKA